MQRQSGFTLIEIAIVMVITGLLLSGGLLAVAKFAEGGAETKTDAQLDLITNAMQVYVIQNGCLPCPTTVAALDGQSYAGGTAYNTGCLAQACTTAHGIVPWRTIGIQRHDVIDPHGSFIDYVVATGLTSSSTSMKRVNGTFPVIGSNIQVERTNGVSQVQASNTAYLLISHGRDKSHGYSATNGTLQADPHGSATQSCNSLARSTCGAPNTATAFVHDVTSRTDASYFDDVVRFTSAAVIIQKCGAGSCGNPD